MKLGLRLQSKSIATYTVVSCHFGDLFWITHLADSLQKFGDDRINDFVIVDQSREKQPELSVIPGVTKVLAFDPDEDQIAIGGHDHPASLDRVLRYWQFRSSHVIIFDSDAFPISPRWLADLPDVILAEAPGTSGELSHPCFMVFPVEAIQRVSFSEGFLDRHDKETRLRFDTGRMVARQLRESGYEVVMSPAIAGYQGLRGHMYAQGTVYHHGHASHTAAPQHLQVFTSTKTEELWKRKIARGEWTLLPRDYFRLGYHYLARRISSKLRKMIRRAGS